MTDESKNRAARSGAVLDEIDGNRRELARVAARHSRLGHASAGAWINLAVGVTVGVMTWFAPANNAKATTVVPPTFEEMVDRADLVFVGKVSRSWCEWRPAGTDRVIFTLVEFENTEVIKGMTGASVTLQFLGGSVGNVTLEVVDAPKFQAGERVLLFVAGNGVRFCPLVGLFHGKFGLRKDPKSGRDIVCMHDGNPLRDLTQIGDGQCAEFGPKRAKALIPFDREPIPVELFKQRIRAHLEKKRQ